MTYFPARQYHRRRGLNYCVRDGNRCDPKPMVTDNPVANALTNAPGHTRGRRRLNGGYATGANDSVHAANKEREPAEASKPNTTRRSNTMHRCATVPIAAAGRSGHAFDH